MAAFDKKLVTFAAPGTDATTKEVTCGFQIKAVIFFAAGRTTAGAAANHNAMVGYAHSTTRADQFSCANVALDNVSDHDVGRRTSDTPSDFCIVMVSHTGTAQTLDQEAYVSAIGATSFTLTFDISGSARQIHALCLGGDDLTVDSYQWQSKTGAAGDTVNSGWSFQPDCLVAMTALDTTKGSTAGAATGSFGIADGTTERCVGWGFKALTSGTVDGGMFDSLLSVPFDGSVAMDISLTSLDANGFTLSNPVRSGTARWCGIIGFKGANDLQFEVVADTQPLTNTTKATTTSFEPEAILMMGAGDTSLGRATTANITYGAQTGTGATEAGSIYFGGENAASPSDVSRQHSVTKVLSNLTNNGATPTVVGEANVDSFNATDVTLNWLNVNGSALQWAGLVMGAVAAGGGVSGSGDLEQNASLFSLTGAKGSAGAGSFTQNASLFSMAGVRGLTGTGSFNHGSDSLTGSGSSVSGIVGSINLAQNASLFAATGRRDVLGAVTLAQNASAFAGAGQRGVLGSIALAQNASFWVNPSAANVAALVAGGASLRGVGGALWRPRGLASTIWTPRN